MQGQTPHCVSVPINARADTTLRECPKNARADTTLREGGAVGPAAQAHRALIFVKGPSASGAVRVCQQEKSRQQQGMMVQSYQYVTCRMCQQLSMTPSTITSSMISPHRVEEDVEACRLCKEDTHTASAAAQWVSCCSMRRYDNTPSTFATCAARSSYCRPYCITPCMGYMPRKVHNTHVACHQDQRSPVNSSHQVTPQSTLFIPPPTSLPHNTNCILN